MPLGTEGPRTRVSGRSSRREVREVSRNHISCSRLHYPCLLNRPQQKNVERRKQLVINDSPPELIFLLARYRAGPFMNPEGQCEVIKSCWVMGGLVIPVTLFRDLPPNYHVVPRSQELLLSMTGDPWFSALWRPSMPLNDKSGVPVFVRLRINPDCILEVSTLDEMSQVFKNSHS